MTPDQLPPTHLQLVTKVLPRSRASLVNILRKAKTSVTVAEKATFRLIEITGESVYEMVELGDEVRFWREMRQHASPALEAIQSAHAHLHHLAQNDQTILNGYLEQAGRHYGRTMSVASTIGVVQAALEMILKDTVPKLGRPRHTAGEQYFRQCGQIWQKATGLPLPVNTSDKSKPSRLFGQLQAIALEMCENDKYVRAEFSPSAYRTAAKLTPKKTPPK